MQITYYGHSAFGLEIAGKHVLIDPFISPNEKAAHIEVEKIPADFVLVTHGHQDHIVDVVPIAQRTGATVVSTFEMVNWFGQQGLEKMHPMNHGGSWQFDFGKLKMVNAIHSSSLPNGSYGGNPVGFVIQAEGKTFYYSGDTALTYDMKLIGEEFDLDFAFLCLGDNFTMGVQDAVKAASFINCQDIIGMHFDTFGYIEIDHAAAQQAFSDAGCQLALMEVGSSLER